MTARLSSQHYLLFARSRCKWSSGQVVMGSNLTVGHLQATLSKLLTYGVLRSTQPPTFRGTGNE